MKKRLLGRKAKIVSDNDNYNRFMDDVLTITHVAYSKEDHPGYDSTMEGQALCDFETKKGVSVPFSLYEYEFELI